ncbi:deoxynucleoside kinase [Bacillus pumilus]|uniref:deoxynucleoside kinase n=1 Tax=Bacillus pumilus TaxID=1408 RepID=UPI002280A2CC|nr:deoxynucleoside kinase [Bacillus pumilus]MCY7500185.1 deoxynucleoside kinase [Bacillus pumilus]MCY7528491.1 deoxynucleoside kinase [Bacillus pumilus]MED4439551.1 deoxynucleoside kinase [Bacillus pumilus]MED4489994.1 deoxynucleoside kinase [Bacillus pumilus]
MIIILEGCDCCYKSTVAKQLSKKLDYKILRGSSFEIAKRSQDSLYEYCLGLTKHDNLIIDRYIYSNLVYATKFPGNTKLTHGQVSNIENKLLNKTKLIYLYARPEVIKERILSRGDDQVNTKDIEPIVKLYNEVIPKSKLHTYSIDTEIYDSDEIVEDIIYLVSEEGT